MLPSPKAWAAGRRWQWRLPLFAVLAWQALRPLNEMGPHLFSGITFGAHEFGHLFFALFGEWMAIAGGSLMQLLVPIGAAAVVLRSKDWFGAAVCALFLAASLGDLSWYVADASVLDLDLVSFSSDGGEHDWNYLLGRAGLLGWDREIAGALRAIGWLLVLASSLFTLQLALWMATERPPETSDT